MNEVHNSGQDDTAGHQAPGDWLHQTLDELSTSLRPGGFAAPGEPSGHVTMVGPDSCPDPGVWLHLAINDLPKDESEKLLAHAAMCANCLQRLRQSRETLALDEPSVDDDVDPKIFESSSARWQRQFAARLAETPRRSAVRRIPGFVWWTAGTLAFTLMLAFAFNSWWKAHNSPDHLLDESYSHARSFDLRIPGAHYGPVLPGPQTPAQASQLTTARQLIAAELRKHPGDPQLLHLQARADLLAGQDDAAISILDQLLAQGPVTASLLTDDASAYFQRGLATGSQNDRITALENLRRAEALDPQNPVILFNEAIVLKENGMVSNAIEVWNRFLTVEHDPQWLAEGRQRLQQLEQMQDSLHDQPNLLRVFPVDSTHLLHSV